jgi:hypothetical protein
MNIELVISKFRRLLSLIIFLFFVLLVSLFSIEAFMFYR